MKKQTLGIGLAVVLFGVLLCLPVPEGLSAEGMRCLALFAAVFILYLFEAIHAAVVSLMIVPLLVICHITDISTALSGFSSSSTYLIVGSFVLAQAVIQSGLGSRITYGILLMIGTGARAITLGILLVNIVLAFIIPSSTARTAMMLPICLSIAHAFTGTERRTQFGANLMMTLCVTNSTISAGILTATISNPMAVDYIGSHGGRAVSFADWMLWGMPPALLLTFVSWLLIQCLFRPEQKELSGGRAFIRSRLEELGPVSRKERISMIVFVITVMLWIVGDRFGIDSTAACLLGACVLCLPKVGVLTWDDCKNSISLSVVFICSGGISLGAAMSATGAAGWIAERIFALLHLNMLPTAAVIIVLIVIVQFMHIIFVGTATMANVFFPILAGLAAVAGGSAEKFILPAAIMIGGYPVLMFFNTTPSILCYDTGQVTASDFPRLGLLISAAACAVYAACALWYWPMTGLL